MKDLVQSCHLTKFDAFGVNRNQVVNLETWLKSIQMSVTLRQRPQKPYNLLNFFFFYLCDTLNNGKAYVTFISTSLKW